MSAVKVYVPCDAAARSVGADETAAALASGAKRRGVDIELIRNGTRGMLWREPMIEVATGARVASLTAPSPRMMSRACSPRTSP